MSHSRRKTPKRGFCSAKSDRLGKVVDHRRYRCYARLMANEEHWDYIAPRKIKENPYNWPKDGKCYWPEGIDDYKWMGK